MHLHPALFLVAAVSNDDGSLHVGFFFYRLLRGGSSSRGARESPLPVLGPSLSRLSSPDKASLALSIKLGPPRSLSPSLLLTPRSLSSSLRSSAAPRRLLSLEPRRARSSRSRCLSFSWTSAPTVSSSSTTSL